MMSNFLLPSITKPTKINPGNSTLIDNIFTNNLNPNITSGNFCLNMSDGHLPSFLLIPKESHIYIPKNHNLFRRTMSTHNMEHISDEFNLTNWTNIIKTRDNDVNKSMKCFLSNFNKILDKHAPLKKISNKELKESYKPWISDEIKNKIKEKDKIFQKYLKCKNKERKTNLQKQFKTQKNYITGLLRNEKKKYYQNFFTKYKTNLKMVWKGIKSIINIKSKNYDSINSIEINNQIQTDPKDIADSFNKYFTTVADKIVSKRKYNGNKEYRDFLANRLLENFIFTDCDEDEIETIINSFKIGKSVGPNSVPIKLLKYLGKSICKPLKEIFNLSLRSGIHPDILKLAKTVPIYKKGSRLLVSNYRPISLLSNLNKILEKLVHKRTYSFLEEKNVFTPNNLDLGKATQLIML